MPARVVWRAEDTSVDAVAAALRRCAAVHPGDDRAPTAGGPTAPADRRPQPGAARPTGPAAAGAERAAVSDAAAPPLADTPPPLPRARTLTLLAVAEGADAGMAEALGRAALHHPLRALTLLRQPDRAGPGLDASVRLYAHPRRSAYAAGEEVEIRARGAAADHLEGIVAPLLLTELPVVLWWLGPAAAAGPQLPGLRGLADRLVIDLSRGGEAPADADANMRALAAMPDPASIDEICWRRGRPLRDLVASLFDPPAHRRAAGRVRQVRLRHAAGGRAAALLMAGWIISRLGLGPEAVALVEDEPAGAEKAPHRAAGGRDPSRAPVREVALGPYAVRAAKDGEHAEIQRPEEPPRRARLRRLGAIEAALAVLGDAADPLWPPALAAAARIAGGAAAAGGERR